MEAVDSPEVYYNKGIAEFEEGNYELSAENFKKAIELNDSVFDYYYNLGVSYLNLEQYDLAIETFNKGVPLNNRDTDLYMNLGMAFYNKGEYHKAAKAYKRAVFINSGDPENCNYAGIAFSTVKNYKEAIFYFKQAVKLEPRDVNYNYNLAQAYYDAEKYEAAEECLVNISRFDKQNDQVYCLIGKIYLQNLDYELAKNSFENALKLNPDNKEAQRELDKLIERETRRAKKRNVKEEETISEIEIETTIKDYINSAAMLVDNKEYEAVSYALQEIIELINKLPRAATRYKM